VTAKQNCRGVVQGTTQKVVEYKGIRMISWRKAVLLRLPNDKSLLLWYWETCYSRKATIDDFSAYSTRYQRNRVF